MNCIVKLVRAFLIVFSCRRLIGLPSPTHTIVLVAVNQALFHDCFTGSCFHAQRAQFFIYRHHLWFLISRMTKSPVDLIGMTVAIVIPVHRTRPTKTI